MFHGTTPLPLPLLTSDDIRLHHPTDTGLDTGVGIARSLSRAICLLLLLEWLIDEFPVQELCIKHFGRPLSNRQYFSVYKV